MVRPQPRPVRRLNRTGAKTDIEGTQGEAVHRARGAEERSLTLAYTLDQHAARQTPHARDKSKARRSRSLRGVRTRRHDVGRAAGEDLGHLRHFLPELARVELVTLAAMLGSSVRSWVSSGGGGTALRGVGAKGRRSRGRQDRGRRLCERRL
eukprot:6184541-Pleurochrysis_carterae.AAC.4